LRELRHQQAGGSYYPKRSQVGYAPEELPSQQTGFKQELPAAEPGMEKQGETCTGLTNSVAHEKSLAKCVLWGRILPVRLSGSTKHFPVIRLELHRPFNTWAGTRRVMEGGC